MVAFMAENLEQVIRQVGDPIARALGIEILDVQCTGKPTSPLVCLILDKNGGLGIQDCEKFHQSLRRTWEVTQPSGPLCRFEVSSPGLDRPLKDRKDFRRVQGQRLRLTVKNDQLANAVVFGRLVAVTDIGLQLVDDRGKTILEHSVLWSEIVKARIEIEF
jgi:ribosome maturation factor RimP